MNSDQTQGSEAISFQLARDMQQELVRVLDSLGGKELGAVDKFLAYTARHLNRAVEGYVFMRETRRVDCSKLLIRPVIETTFRLRALSNQPSLIFRIMYTERLKNQKWHLAASERQGVPYDKDREEDEWRRFTKQCAIRFPGCDLREKEISIFRIAEAADLDSYYSSYYSLYCNTPMQIQMPCSVNLMNYQILKTIAQWP